MRYLKLFEAYTPNDSSSLINKLSRHKTEEFTQDEIDRLKFISPWSVRFSKT